MGTLKDMLEKAMTEIREPQEVGTDAWFMFKGYRTKFRDMVGEPLIWRSHNNPHFKSPQLVKVEQAFAHFVLVVKTVWDVNSQPSSLRYAINYASIHSGHDSLESLEMESI